VFCVGEDKKHASFSPSLLNLFVEFLVSGIEFGFFSLLWGWDFPFAFLFSLFFGVCSGSVVLGCALSFRSETPFVCLCVCEGGARERGFHARVCMSSY
jgi:hypothetical protein